MVSVLINPMDLQATHPPLIQALFKQLCSRFIPAGKYQVIADNETYSITLTHGLFKNLQDDITEPVTIEVLNPKPLENFKNPVFESCGTVAETNQFRFVAAAQEQRLWIKVIPHTEELNDADVRREHAHTQLNPKLLVKTLIADIDSYYLILRKPNGKSLSSILDQVKSNTLKLSNDQLIALTTAILIAFKEQIFVLKLIHNNVNCDHIYVDLRTMKVTFVNYEDAISISSRVHPMTIKGDNYFFAPELFRGELANRNSDLYSLGLTLAELWGDESMYNLPPHYDDLRTHLDHLTHRTWLNLFENKGLSERFQSDFLILLDNLVAIAPQERRNIVVTLACWEEIVRIDNQGLSPDFLMELSRLSWSKNKGRMAVVYNSQEPPYPTSSPFNPLKTSSF